MNHFESLIEERLPLQKHNGIQAINGQRPNVELKRIYLTLTERSVILIYRGCALPFRLNRESSNMASQLYPIMCTQSYSSPMTETRLRRLDQETKGDCLRRLSDHRASPTLRQSAPLSISLTYPPHRREIRTTISRPPSKTSRLIDVASGGERPQSYRGIYEQAYFNQRDTRRRSVGHICREWDS